MYMRAYDVIDVCRLVRVQISVTLGSDAPRRYDQTMDMSDEAATLARYREAR